MPDSLSLDYDGRFKRPSPIKSVADKNPSSLERLPIAFDDLNEIVEIKSGGDIYEQIFQIYCFSRLFVFLVL